MLKNRRYFLQQSMLTAGALATSVWSKANTKTNVVDEQRLTILHTNDMHSHLDPFPLDGSVNGGMGGVAARAQIINDIRSKNEHVLLLDAGDIFQGTPYFNFYKGEPEIKAMSLMKYDAVTIGNHDFDAGFTNYKTKIAQHATFPVLI